MNKHMLMIILGLVSISHSAWAKDVTDELTQVREQAREERVREEELQMMRLELEKLKLQAETRKTMADLGMASGVSSSTGEVERVKIMVKSIFISADKTVAVVETGGIRQIVRENDKIGSFIIKKIEPSSIIMVDEKGAESQAGLGL